jgi:homoserine kinase type II
MALLTPLSNDAARELVRGYGLELSRIDALSAGSVNSNFQLYTLDGQRLFLRIYEEQDQAGAAREVALVRRLGARGVPSAAPLVRRDGAWLSEHAGKPVAVFQWAGGAGVCQKQVTPAICAQIGAALARVHLVGSEALGAGRFRVSDLHERLDFIEAHAAAELAQAAVAVRERLRQYASRRDASLPQGLIHGDLFKDNVLWLAGKISALLDFESASEGPFAYDLMVTLHAWCYSDAFEPELVQSLLEGYQRVRPLGPGERCALPIEAGIAALRFAITRITDFSMRVTPPATPVRDYRRFLARLDAIERGELEQLGIAAPS